MSRNYEEYAKKGQVLMDEERSWPMKVDVFMPRFVTLECFFFRKGFLTLAGCIQKHCTKYLEVSMKSTMGNVRFWYFRVIWLPTAPPAEKCLPGKPVPPTPTGSDSERHRSSSKNQQQKDNEAMGQKETPEGDHRWMGGPSPKEFWIFGYPPFFDPEPPE